MDIEEIEPKRKAEKDARALFNKTFRVQAEDKEIKLPLGHSSIHKFDLFVRDKYIGGITTSPWKNKTGSNNTGGQDRVSTELLWLSLWEGKEHRVMILTDREMAEKTFKRWSGCSFPSKIEIFFYDEFKKELHSIGLL